MFFPILVFGTFLGMVNPVLWAQNFSREDRVVTDSQLVLTEIMQIPAKSIPEALFKRAEGIAVFPGLKKGGFIVGVQRGKGVLVVKNQDGKWDNPRFVTLTGGSLGFQAGVQSADVILVFCTQKSVASALKGQFTVGADATVAAGPVGRQAAIGTDVQLTSEIYSYSRSRGIFLGAALDGSLMEVDMNAYNTFYFNGVPEHAVTLVQRVAEYAGEEDLPPQTEPLPTLDETETLRISLYEASTRLQAILDPQWQKWLELPLEIGVPGAPKPPLADLQVVQKRFRSVAENPQYQVLNSREEFQTTFKILNEYMEKY